MTYLVVQKWSNTKNNHAGMFHLCKLLVQNFPDKYELISIPDFKNQSTGLLSLFYNLFLSNFIWHSYYLFISIGLFFKIKRDDIIILFEYLTPGIRQDYIIYTLKFSGHKNIRVFGFVHLTPSILDVSFSTRIISKRLELLNGAFTFGSSLTDFLLKFSNISISTFRHYSDLNFYKPSNSFSTNKRINVLVIGQQARNYSILLELVKSIKYLNFYIIVSDFNIVKDLLNIPNVFVYSNISEDKLIQIMNGCHCSLGMYDDVVGSNVLSNCISMGIISLVNDVGSVRDYLTINDSFFCNNIDEYVNALFFLKNNPDKLNGMRDLLINKRKLLDFKIFHYELEKLLNV